MIPRKRNTYYEGQLKDAVFGFRRRLLASGEAVRSFEQAFAEIFGFSDAVATCTGRDGLLLLLEACGVTAGDEIVLPAYTLGELVNLLKSRGYVPVLADVDGSSYQLTAKSVEPRITERTKAIIATHLFGWPCDIVNIVELARERGLIVIED
ncbi:MAG TPA: DegT/DnrJ/EryC1/StrS aminotransferase family protein, partial [Proteobacteria bacterium]|nr:DegT/DnrJ/EryC1/StrS aminotransferase family protein [Pseudomonadota bacterium]